MLWLHNSQEVMIRLVYMQTLRQNQRLSSLSLHNRDPRFLHCSSPCRSVVVTHEQTLLVGTY